MVHVTSEVGRLRRALVHEPGPEVDRMVPAMMEELLFDDILDGDVAREEHAQLRRVLQLCGVEVVDAADLLVESLALDAAREWVLEILGQDLSPGLHRLMAALEPGDLARALIGGMRHPVSPAAVEVEDLYAVAPLPNLCFQRDPQVILGDGVIFASMAAPARHREAILARVVFRFHPDFAGIPVRFEPLEPGPDPVLRFGSHPPCLEGGDLLILSRDVLAVGRSERTHRGAIQRLARALARHDASPRWLVEVQIPRRRAYMHLDTLITQVDRGACLVYPPVILGDGAEAARVFEIDLHDPDSAPQPRDDLLSCLASHGLALEPISCGGDDPVAQQREQWTDGANVLALAPGLILLFDRNRATAEELSRRGFRMVLAEDLLLGRDEVDPDGGERACVLLTSHEISRARGGPHCLVHPLVRDEV